MNKYSAVIFDFDRTIADTEDAVLYCHDQTLRNFGYTPLDKNKFKQVIGKPADVQIKFLTGENDPGLIKKISDWHTKMCDEHMSEMTKFFPYVKEGLIELQKAGIKTGIISNKNQKYIITPLERDGILPFINKIYGPEQVKMAKPNPEGLLRMINEFGLDKREVLYIGDSLIDQAAANNCDVDFAAMLTGGTGQKEFDLNGSYTAVFNRFCDLINALI
ncbi:MAG: HAD family hydrolase [Treponema sp.]|nr:HAD family hydrolase [Treponema sp.]